MTFLLVLLIIIIVIASQSIKVVKQSEVYIIERLGKFHKIADAGLTIIIPFFDHVRSVVSLKQQSIDIPPQKFITKDNITISIDAIIIYQITDPEKAVYEIQSLKKGIEYLSITTIRDIVGKMNLDEILNSRSRINSKFKLILDESAYKWGYKIYRAEIKDITPPVDIKFETQKFSSITIPNTKKALVIEDINWITGTGQIEFEGEVLSAKASEQVNIPKGTEVEIEKIEGVKAFVKTLKETIQN